MYATTRRYHLAEDAPLPDLMTALQRDAPTLLDLAGLRAFQAIDLDGGRVLVVAVFDGKNDAEAASSRLDAVLGGALGDHVAGRPEIDGGLVGAFVVREAGEPARLASGQYLGAMAAADDDAIARAADAKGNQRAAGATGKKRASGAKGTRQR